MLSAGVKALDYYWMDTALVHGATPNLSDDWCFLLCISGNASAARRGFKGGMISHLHPPSWNEELAGPMSSLPPNTHTWYNYELRRLARRGELKEVEAYMKLKESVRAVLEGRAEPGWLIK